MFGITHFTPDDTDDFISIRASAAYRVATYAMSLSTYETVLITGASAGIGKDIARQLAERPNITRIYLGCRSQQRADTAVAELVSTTKRSIFHVVIMDLCSVESIQRAVAGLTEPIDVLFMNAGGMGGTAPLELTQDRVTTAFASNVLGHAVLLESLVKANKLRKVAVNVSTEAVRGVAVMGIKKPEFETASADEFASIIDGTYFVDKQRDVFALYAQNKYIGLMWFTAYARKHPNLRFISVSPGSTSGTESFNSLPWLKRILLQYIAMPIILPLMGMVHSLATGAKRLIDAVDNSTFTSGGFYASTDGELTGSPVDQISLMPELKNEQIQENAYNAVHRFI